MTNPISPTDEDRFRICPKTAEAAVEYLRGVGHADAAASLEGVLHYWLPQLGKKDQTEHARPGDSTDNLSSI